MNQKNKEQFVHSVFESVAPKYDFMNDLLSFRRHKAWRKFTMKQMAVQPGDSALDVCCGTADWTISFAKASQTGEVIGLDFSRNMLGVAERKIMEQQLSDRITLIEGNAMALPYADDHFDYATIGFALRNVPDLKQVLREMLRVVKPGGTIVCLELSKPTWQPFKGLYYLYFRHILPLIGRLVAKRYEQYKWLPESLIQFPDHRQLATIFQEIGCMDVTVHPLFGGVAALHMGKKGKQV